MNHMGFFAGELEAVLTEHARDEHTSPWDALQHLGVHQQQIDRLQAAAEEFDQVATLPPGVLQQLKQELALQPLEWARLQAGIDADTFLRLLMYHHYPIDEAANKANAVFAAALRDKLATGGATSTVYTGAIVEAPPAAPRRRGRRRYYPQEMLG
jgi:hypothetical protein